MAWFRRKIGCSYARFQVVAAVLVTPRHPNSGLDNPLANMARVTRFAFCLVIGPLCPHSNSMQSELTTARMTVALETSWKGT